MTTLTNQQIIVWWKVIDGILKQSAVRLKRKFAYTLGWNKGKLEPFVNACNIGISKDAEYQEYGNERIEVNRQFAMKDDKGVPIIFGNDEVRIVDKTGHGQAIKALEAKYSEAVARHEAFMAEEHQVELRPVKLSMVPCALAGVVSDVMVAVIEDDLLDDADEDAPELQEEVIALRNSVKQIEGTVSKMQEDIKALSATDNVADLKAVDSGNSKDA